MPAPVSVDHASRIPGLKDWLQLLQDRVCCPSITSSKYVTTAISGLITEANAFSTAASALLTGLL